MINPDMIQHVAHAFSSTIYVRKRRPRRQGAGHFLVADYIFKYPLHIFVETTVEIGEKRSSTERRLEKVYYTGIN